MLECLWESLWGTNMVVGATVQDIPVDILDKQQVDCTALDKKLNREECVKDEYSVFHALCCP